MKSICIFCICGVWAAVIAIVCPVTVNAERLPGMSDEPWLGYFSGYTSKNFEFGINNEGQSEIYLLG